MSAANKENRAYPPMIQGSRVGLAHEYSEQVARVIYSLAAYGVPQGAIVFTVGLSWNTIMNHYQDAWKAGRAQVEKKLAGKIMRLALEGNSEQVSLRASMFYLKTNFGWSEADHAAGNVPVHGANEITAEMSDEEAAEAYALSRADPRAFQPALGPIELIEQPSDLFDAVDDN